VSSENNRNLYELLIAFKARTGYGVLCNTSLNFKGRGSINEITTVRLLNSDIDVIVCNAAT